MEKINFEDGKLVEKAYTIINGTKHYVEKATYTGTTPLSAFVLNKMQNNIETAIEEKSSLPAGGTIGQVLAKASDEDNDVEWIEQSGGLIVTVVDNLESTSETDALSAKQGKNLYEKMKGYVLYNNSTGTTGNITLSTSVANYDYLEIFYSINQGKSSKSTRIFSPNGKNVELSSTYFDTSNSENIGYIFGTKIVNILGTAVSISDTRRIYFYPSYEKPLTDKNNVITIYKIIGYKY